MSAIEDSGARKTLDVFPVCSMVPMHGNFGPCMLNDFPSSPFSLSPTEVAQDDDRDGRPTHRLFYAIFPDLETTRVISRIAHVHDLDRNLRGPRLLADRYHVTLNHIDDCYGRQPSIEDRAIRIGDRVSMGWFNATFTYADSFRGRPEHHPYVLRGDEGIAGFLHLHMAIEGAGLSEGLDVHDADYKPHLTLQYGKKFVGPLNISPISWPVREFALVLSYLRQTRYKILKRWPLGERPFDEIGPPFKRGLGDLA